MKSRSEIEEFERDNTEKNKVPKSSGIGIGCFTFIIIVAILIFLSFKFDPESKAGSYEKSISENAKTEAFVEEVKLPVAVGNHVYYVDKDAQIEYDELMITVNCADYGIKSYYATGAPQTADAVVALYGAVFMDPYTNDNDVEGVIIEGIYEETTTVKTFCFTIDDVFHAIEVWYGPDTNGTVADDIFNSVCYRSIESLREEAKKQLEEDAYEEYLENAYEDAIRAYMQTEVPDDPSDYARGFYSRGARGYR